MSRPGRVVVDEPCARRVVAPARLSLCDVRVRVPARNAWRGAGGRARCLCGCVRGSCARGLALAPLGPGPRDRRAARLDRRGARHAAAERGLGRVGSGPHARSVSPTRSAWARAPRAWRVSCGRSRCAGACTARSRSRSSASRSRSSSQLTEVVRSTARSSSPTRSSRPGGDPTLALLAVGASLRSRACCSCSPSEPVALAAHLCWRLLLLFARARQHAHARFAASRRRRSGSACGPKQEQTSNKQGQPHGRRRQRQQTQNNEQLEFRDNYDSEGRQVPLAVVLLHDDYSPPSGIYYFRQAAFSQYNGQRLVARDALRRRQRHRAGLRRRADAHAHVPNARGDPRQLETTVGDARRSQPARSRSSRRSS